MKLKGPGVTWSVQILDPIKKEADMANKERLRPLEKGITEDYRKMIAARFTGEVLLERALESSMNDRLEDYLEQMPDIILGEE